MIIVCVRTLIVYLIVLFTLRVMGKSELSKLSTFQMVVLFMIAELASMPIDSPTASLINGIVAIFTLLFLQVTLSLLSLKNKKFMTFINGKPSIIIDKGMLNVKEMRRLRITISDLLEQLRIEDCPSLSEVEYAVMESNGQLSVIKKSDVEMLPILLISDGTIYESNLQKASITKGELIQLIHQKGLSSTEEVFAAFCDGNRLFHIYPVPHGKQEFSKEVK